MPQSLIPSASAPWGDAWVEGYGARFSEDKCAFFAGEYPAELYVIDLDNGNPDLLAGELVDGLYATLDLSPDGNRIVYSAGIVGQHEPDHINIPLRHMWVINTDGTGQVQISEDYGENLRWSPDGSKIAFLRNDELWLIDPDGTGEEKFPTEAYFIHYLEWSPNGNKLAYWSSEMRHSSCTRLWIVDFTDDTQELVFDITNAGVSWATYDGMAWSPDGNSIALILSGAAGEQVFLLKLSS
jgi:Tol biopolymer transport system component